MRRRALALLGAVGRGRFAADLLRPDEHRFVRELVLGVLRRRLTLDTVHDAFGSRPAADLDAPVLETVRMGLYQLLFMDGVPPHAAVSETVSAAPERGRGYVNAILRTILRECHTVPEHADRGGASPTKRLPRPGRTVTFFSRPVFPDPERDRVAWLACLHSHPELLVRRWLAREPEATVVARMEANNAAVAMVLRPRAGRIGAPGLVAALAAERIVGGLVPRSGGPAAVAVPPGSGRGLFGAAFHRGLFSVQALEQMDAAEILAPRAGEAIWDACAAPGGKATQLAELLESAGPGTVVATDASAERLQRLQENVARLGLRNVAAAGFDLLEPGPPPGAPAGRGFDAVLVDAPCSNTAVLGSRPEARWRLRPDTFAEMARLQARMIEAARRRLAPGGRLVFATCSLEPEEGVDHGLAPTRSPLVWTDPALP